MGIENLGLDFDGVLRKWPRFVQWYADFLSPQDILVRAKLFFIRKLINYFCMQVVPVILDGELIERIKQLKPKRIIVVSGRYKMEEKREVKTALEKVLHVDKYYFRDSEKEREEYFKERILRQEHVTCFIEDRAYVVAYLRSKGFNVKKISEVKKDGSAL